MSGAAHDHLIEGFEPEGLDPGVGRAVLRVVLATLFAIACVAALFLVLPVIQAITRPPKDDLVVRRMDTATLEAPEAPAEEDLDEPEPDPEPEPELDEAPEQLDLSQLELALNPGFGDGAGGASLGLDLRAVSGKSGEVDDLFSLSELDQKPRCVYQPGPVMSSKIRKRAPGTVYVIFVVDQRGRVQQPKVQSSTDPVFDEAALKAVQKWKFEPGKRDGKAVRFKMRVPITFPKS